MKNGRVARMPRCTSLFCSAGGGVPGGVVGDSICTQHLIITVTIVIMIVTIIVCSITVAITSIGNVHF